MSATLHALHICPRCFSELATGVDIAGAPRLCKRCVVLAHAQKHLDTLRREGEAAYGADQADAVRYIGLAPTPGWVTLPRRVTSQTPAVPPPATPEPDVEIWLWRMCIVVLLGIAAGCMLEMLLEAWR